MSQEIEWQCPKCRKINEQTIGEKMPPVLHCEKCREVFLMGEGKKTEKRFKNQTKLN